MLKSNSLIGLALLIGATVIGVHAYNTDYTKTDSGATLTRIAPTPRTACFAGCLNLPKDQDAQACVTECDHALPLRPVLDLTNVKPCPNEDAPTITPITAKKNTAVRKFNFAKMGATHHHKSKVLHAYKSKPHKHHSNHAPGYGGHGHSGPQKIPSHHAPPHLTGPPPGCR
jgi:hypothetical protein